MTEPLQHEPDALDSMDDFAEAEVVKIHNDSGIDRMTEDQRKRVNRFWEVLANAMPLEGRDYEVRFEPLPDGKAVKTAMKGLTELGAIFLKAVTRQWAVEGGKDYDIRKE